MAQPAFSLVAIAFNISVIPSFPRWRPAGERRLVRSARDSGVSGLTRMRHFENEHKDEI